MDIAFVEPAPQVRYIDSFDRWSWAEDASANLSKDKEYTLRQIANLRMNLPRRASDTILNYLCKQISIMRTEDKHFDLDDLLAITNSADVNVLFDMPSWPRTTVRAKLRYVKPQEPSFQDFVEE